MPRRLLDATWFATILDAAAIQYAIFDTYPVDESAPITSRTPRDGFATIVNGARLSITGDKFVGTGNTTDVACISYSVNNGSATTIADGDLLCFSGGTVGNAARGYGLDADTAVVTNYTSFNLSTNRGLTLYDGGTFYNFAANIFDADVYVVFWFANAVTYVYTYDSTGDATWHLRMILKTSQVSAARYIKAQMTVSSDSSVSDLLQVAMRRDMTTLNSTSCGTSAGSTATAPSADFVTRIALTTLQTSGTFEYRFRIQDASNYWRVTVNTAGDIDLSEVVAGTPTSRASSAAVVASGESIFISAIGTTINVWADSNRDTYTSASNFQTETSVELESLGTDGVVGSVDLYEYYPTGDIQSALTSVAQS